MEANTKRLINVLAQQNRVEEAKLQAAADLESNQGAYKRFQATAKRRRLMKREYEKRIAKITHKLVVYLKQAAGEEEKYNNLLESKLFSGGIERCYFIGN